MHVSIIKHKHPLELLCTKYCLAVLLKWTNWKFIFPWRKLATNWHVLQIAKVHFRYTIWLKYYEVHVSSLWWCMHVQKVKVSTNKAYKKIVCQNFQYFQPLKITLMCTCGFIIDMNTYEGIPKHSWKKIVQLLWTVVTYLLKKCWIWNWTWYCIGTLHSFLNFTADLMNTLHDTWWIWQSVSL